MREGGTMQTVLNLQALEADEPDAIFGLNSWISVDGACWRRRNCPY